MSELNVCLFSDTVFDVNGVSRFINDISKISDRKKFNIITSTHKSPLDKEANKIINVKAILSMKMPFYDELDLVLPNPSSIAKQIKQLSPSLIHISTPGPIGVITSFYAKKYKIPRAGIYHTDFPRYLYKNTNSKLVQWLTNWYMKKFYQNFEAIFVRSDEYKKILMSEMNFPEEKIYTLKAGINIKNFSHEFRDKNIWEKLGLYKDSFKFIYVGRITKEKNVSYLIDVFKEYSKRYGHCELVFIGSGEYEKQSDKLKQYNIHFLGKKFGKELATIYASSDCFIFPSTTDTLGQVVLEGMCSGLPCIVTDQGGPQIYVKDANCGEVLSIYDKEKWIESIHQISIDEVKYNNYRQNAIEYMKSMSIEKSFEDFTNKNEEILKKLTLKSL